MKKIIRYSALCLAGALLCAGTLASCVDPFNVGDASLEKSPGVDVDITTIFSKGENAEYFLWNLYNNMRNPLTRAARMNQTPAEALADTYHDYCGWGGSGPYYNGSIQPGDGNDKFPFVSDGGENRGIWEAIRAGWIIIENIDSVPDRSAEQKSHIKGEAYLIMATRYFDCLRNYGGLPLVDHVFSASETFEGGRATVEETVDFIDGLIQKSIDESGFRWRWEDQDTWAGRLSKSGAYALRAKLWLFAASPLFNAAEPYMDYGANVADANPLHVWYGGYRADLWQKALNACEEFFRLNTANGGWYALLQPTANSQGEIGEREFRNAFRAAYWHRGNSEKVIAVHTSALTGQWGWGNSADANGPGHFGMANATLEFFEMFPMADGTNYPYKNGVYNGPNPDNVDIFVNRDPRLYETMMITRENEPFAALSSIQLWQGGNAQNTDGMYNDTNGDRFKSGFPLYKWVLDYSEGLPRTHNLSYSYIRMADMHLMYAEALAETGNLAKALEEVNKVRARVGLRNIETANPGLNLTSNKENLIDEILRERACEFALEDERLFDIIRRKEIEKFTSPLHEMVFWRKTADGGKDLRKNTLLAEGEAWPDFIYETRQIQINLRSWWSGGWSNKYLLSPFPRDEVNKGYGLTQNPGW